MYNVDIRDAIKAARLFNYEVATAIGMNESAFSRKISRKELPQEEKERILKVIEKIEVE